MMEKLQENREAIYKIAKEFGVSNIRVFGSVARGEEKRGSDVDLLVSVSNYTKYCKGSFGQNIFQEKVEKILRRRVDVISEKSLHPLLKEEIIATSKAI